MFNDIIQNYPHVPVASLALFMVHSNGKKGYGQEFDANWVNRHNLAKRLLPVFAPRHKPLLRFLLEQEIECCGRYDGDDRLLRGLAYMLYVFSDIEDAELFYRVKFETTFDASFEVDIELIFGENKSLIKEFYRGKNKNIVETIELYETRPFISKQDYMTRVQQHNLLAYWLGDDY